MSRFAAARAFGSSTAAAVRRGWSRYFGHDLFVSYSRSDLQALARPLVAYLSPRYFIFLDRNEIEGGEQFRRRIRRDLRRSRYLVVLLSPPALDSHWVRLETRYFRRVRGPQARFIPVFVAPVRVEALPKRWRWLQRSNGLSLAAAQESLVDREDRRVGEIAKFVAATFDKIRQRTWLAAVLLVFLISLVSAIAWSVHLRIDRRTDALVSQQLELAAAAETEQRHALAAEALRRAVALDASRDDLRVRLREVSDRISWHRAGSIRLAPEWTIVAVDDSSLPPRVLVRREESAPRDAPQLAVVTRDGEVIELDASLSISDSLSVTTDGVAYLIANGRLCRFQTADPTVTWRAASNPLAAWIGLTSQVSIDVGDIFAADAISIVTHSSVGSHLISIDPTTLERRWNLAFALEEGAEYRVALARNSTSAAVVVRRETASFDLRLSIRTIGIDGVASDAYEFVPTFSRTQVGSIYSLADAKVASDSDQVFVAVSEFNLAGARESRADGVRWIAVDLKHPRAPWVMEPGIVELKALGTFHPLEAIVRTEQDSLRALPAQSIVVRDRPTSQLLDDVDLWRAHQTEGPRPRARTIAIRAGELIELLDTHVAFRTRLDSEHSSEDRSRLEPSRLELSRSGKWLAVELRSATVESDSIVDFWSRAEPR